MSLCSNVNQVALSISAQHLNMAQDLLVVIGTCQQRQVMILKHYFYMPPILSSTVIIYFTCMLCLLLRRCRNCLISVFSVIIFIQRQFVIVFVYGNEPYVTLSVSMMHHDLHVHAGPPAHSPSRHLFLDLLALTLDRCQHNVNIFPFGLCQEKIAIIFVFDTSIYIC